MPALDKKPKNIIWYSQLSSQAKVDGFLHDGGYTDDILVCDVTGVHAAVVIEIHMVISHVLALHLCNSTVSHYCDCFITLKLQYSGKIISNLWEFTKVI